MNHHTIHRISRLAVMRAYLNLSRKGFKGESKRLRYAMGNSWERQARELLEGVSAEKLKALSYWKIINETACILEIMALTAEKGSRS